MPNFFIYDNSISPQTLGSGNVGYVGVNGELVSTAFNPAITVTGGASLVVLGAVTAIYDAVIEGSTTFFDVTVGATGQLLAGASAINLLSALSVTIDNHGLIKGLASAISTTNVGEGEMLITNTGTITATSDAIDVDIDIGYFRMVNTGTIVALKREAMNVFCGTASIDNAGEIHGNVRLLTADFGTSLFVNTGLVTGYITFGEGDDTFTNLGGTVAGTIDGGNGSDTYTIDRDDLQVQDSGTAGTDTVRSSVSHSLYASIENLVLTGSNNIRGVGTDFANTITGNLGDNLIKGRGGDDLLLGGDGDDTIKGGVGSDTMRPDDGDDVMDAGDVLGIDVFDCASAAPFDINLATGRATSAITGTDTISGFEVVLGGFGNDTITGGGADDELFGFGGTDIIAGGGGNDTISGGSFNSGGTGDDTLSGGKGRDTFLFQLLDEFPFAGPDTITDFRPGQDVIDLSVIDANDTGPGNGAFAFGGAAFLPSGQASVRVVQDTANNLTYVDVRDTNGASTDLRIILTGLLTLTADDFVL